MSELQTNAEDLAALERFVVENDDLLALEERIGRFNIFEALGIARAEIRHSNFLAWLLDPAESHGQSDLFLKALLVDIARRAREQGIKPPFSPVHLDGEDLSSVEVRREWKNIDLILTSASPAFVVAVENKVDSGEHSDQLRRYQDTVSAEFLERPALHVYITPTGARASRPGWVGYSFGDIHRVLDRCVRTRAGAIGGDVAAFIDHYLRLLGSRFMDDPDIADLCRRIYRNHRQAIDLIVEHAGSRETELIERLADRLEEQGSGWVLAERKPRYVNVVPDRWRDKLPGIGTWPKNDPRDWMVIEVSVDGDGAWYKLWIGPTSRASLDAAVTEELARDSCGLGSRLRKRNAQGWTNLGGQLWVPWSTVDDATEAAAAVAQRLHDLSPSLDRWTEVVLRLIRETSN